MDALILLALVVIYVSISYVPVSETPKKTCESNRAEPSSGAHGCAGLINFARNVRILRTENRPMQEGQKAVCNLTGEQTVARQQGPSGSESDA
jgi:hypothetical protein